MFASNDTISGGDGSKPKSATPNMVIIDLNDDTLGEYDTDEMTTSKSNKNGLKKPIINVCLDMDLSESEVELMNASSNAFFKRAYTRRSEDIFPQNAPFACPYKECNKIFKERIQLYKHYRNHDEKRHKCQFCDQKFLYRKDRKIHERTHTGERPYVCQLCNRAFTQKCTLDNHLNTHKKGVKGEVCKICGRSYAYKKSLAYHIKDKHPEYLTEQHYQCQKCEKKYIGLCRYKIHIAKCKGKVVFHCQQCSSVFAKEAQLQAHKESCPFRAEMFQCGICSVIVGTEDVLRNHMKAAHGIGFDQCFQVQVLSEVDPKSSRSSEETAELIVPAAYNLESQSTHEKTIYVDTSPE